MKINFLWYNMTKTKKKFTKKQNFMQNGWVKIRRNKIEKKANDFVSLLILVNY